MVHPLVNAIPNNGTQPAPVVRQHLAASGVWPVATAGAVATSDLTLLDVKEVSLAGQSFVLDPLDTTTAHDGVTCLVSLDGKRFKPSGLELGDAVVETRGLTAPPGSPAVGQKWLLPAAPTGAWAAYGKNIGQWTAAGWRFVAPRQGLKVYVKDEDKHLYYSAAAVWSEYPAASLAPGSIPPLSLSDPFAIIRVEDMRNAPPGSMPGAGTAYIVGASPTGAWAGQVYKVARSDGTAWQFLAPSEGVSVYRKDLKILQTYRSGLWTATIAAAGVQQVKRMFVASEALGAIGTSLVYAGGQVTLTSATGRFLRFTVFQIGTQFGTGSAGDNFEIDIYKDSDAVQTCILERKNFAGTGADPFTSSLDGQSAYTFLVSVADGLPHVWRVGTKRVAGSTNRTCTIKFDILIEELELS